MAVTVNGTPATDSYSSAVTTITATMPSGIVAGELLVTHLVIDDGSRLEITPPSGWSLQWRNNQGSSTVLQAVYTRIATGSESGSYDYTIDLSSVCSVQTFRIGGQHSTYSDVTQSTNAGNSTTLTATSITTVTNDALALTFYGCGSSSNIPSLPSGWTNVTDGNGSSRGWRIASKAIAIAGAVGNATSSQDSSRTWIASMWAVRPASGTQYTQSVAGTLTDSGALSKRGGKAAAGSLTSAGALTKQDRTAKAGALTSAGTIAKQARATMAGSLTSAGALAAIRTVLMALAGALGMSGAVSKQTGKSTDGTLTSGGTVAKQTRKGLAGSLTSGAALSALRTILLTLAGALGLSGDATKQTRTTKAGTLSSAGNATRQTNKSTAGTLTSAGALSFIRTVLMTLAGALGLSGAVTKQTAISTGGVLSIAGSITKRISRTIAGVLDALGTVIGEWMQLRDAGIEFLMRDEPALSVAPCPPLRMR